MYYRNRSFWTVTASLIAIIYDGWSYLLWCTHQIVEDCKLVDRLFSHSKFYARWSWHVCFATLGDGERWRQFWRPLMQLFICCGLVFLCEPSAPLVGRIHHAWIVWIVRIANAWLPWFGLSAAVVLSWLDEKKGPEPTSSIYFSSEGVFLWSLFSVASISPLPAPPSSEGLSIDKHEWYTTS